MLKNCKVKSQNSCVTVVVYNNIEIQIPTTTDIIDKKEVYIEIPWKIDELSETEISSEVVANKTKNPQKRKNKV